MQIQPTIVVLEDEKNRKLIGKAPTYIEKETMIHYFCYVFEFQLNSKGYGFRFKKDLEQLFKDEIKELHYNWDDLSPEKIWWLCYLIATKLICEDEGYQYASHTINHILGKIEELSEESLEKYCNEIQFILYNDNRHCLIPRLLSLKDLDSSIYSMDYYVAYFDLNKEDIMKVLKKWLKQKDMYPEKLELYKQSQYSKKYCTFHEYSFELFGNFFLTMHSILNNHPIVENSSFEAEFNENVFDNILYMYIEQVLANKENAEKLQKGLKKIISPLKNIKRNDGR